MFRKNVLNIFIFAICMFVSSSINSYAAVGDGLYKPDEGWVGHNFSQSELIEFTGNWQHVGYWGMGLSGEIKKDDNGNEIFEGFNPNSKIEFTFKGTALRILSCLDAGQASKYRIIIDDDVDEIIEIDIPSIASGGHRIQFEKMDMDNKEHKVTIIPTEYFGDREGSVPKYNYKLESLHIIGELLPNKDDGTINEEENVVLDVEPQIEKIKIDQEVVADLTINNIEKITAEDIRIKYDSSKLEYLGYEEVEGIKLIKDIQNNDEIRVILASQGEANIINAKEVLFRLKFRGIASGEAIVDVTKGRVTDGIEMEKDLEDSECGKGIILIEEQEGFIDVNNSGEFTLLDLGIDARHLNKDPNVAELSEYNTDIIEDGSINDMDLLEIGKLMLENGNYSPNNY